MSANDSNTGTSLGPLSDAAIKLLNEARPLSHMDELLLPLGDGELEVTITEIADGRMGPHADAFVALVSKSAAADESAYPFVMVTMLVEGGKVTIGQAWSYERKPSLGLDAGTEPASTEDAAAPDKGDPPRAFAM